MRNYFSIFAIFALAGCAAAPKKPTATHELNLGHYHCKVTTRSREAQRAFDRGLTLAYSFAHFAAEEEFRKATAADPECAMAWWGIALVNGPHINFPMVPPDHAKTAWEAIQKARQFAPKTTPIEQDLIAALAKRYDSAQPDDRSPLDRAYADSMREVWQKFPANADVGALFAESMMDLRPWDLWKNDGTPQPGTPEIVETLERSLWLNPKHPGANHYYIHTVEASPHAEKAGPAAERLGALVPEASHMVHMPAHIYARVGRWNDAANANVRAMHADEIYRAKYSRPGFYAMYMAHNTHFFAWAGMMQGRSAEAVQNARRMVKSVPEEFITNFGPVVDGYLAFVPETMMRFGQWSEILNEPKPPGDLPFSQALWRYTRVAAFAALDRLPEAREEKVRFEDAVRKVPSQATFGNNSATNLLAIAAHCLEAEIAVRDKHDYIAIEHLRKAVAIEDGLRYDEPADWMQPTRHTLGAVLLHAGKSADAESVYRDDLKKYPENGWSLFGLAQSLRAQNKIAEAKSIERRFQKAWRKADFQLTATCLCVR